MRKFTVDCLEVKSSKDLWRKYIEVTGPDGVENFGYNLDAFNDAITGGGPGWPGECEIYFTNTWSIQKLCGETFYLELQRIAKESRTVRIHIELPVSPKNLP